MAKIDLKKLRLPFELHELDWKAGTAWLDGKSVHMIPLAFVDARAVVNRLDEVCGPGGWQVEFKPLPNGDGGCICGLSIKIDGEWVTKWDGAENPDWQPIKGGLSDALKRAAALWGVGRYLYGFKWCKLYATIRGEGSKAKCQGYAMVKMGETKKKKWLRWDPPEEERFPKWALPGGSGIPEPPPKNFNESVKAGEKPKPKKRKPYPKDETDKVAHLGPQEKSPKKAPEPKKGVDKPGAVGMMFLDAVDKAVHRDQGNPGKTITTARKMYKHAIAKGALDRVPEAMRRIKEVNEPLMGDKEFANVEAVCNEIAHEAEGTLVFDNPEEK